MDVYNEITHNVTKSKFMAASSEIKPTCRDSSVLTLDAMIVFFSFPKGNERLNRAFKLLKTESMCYIRF